MLRLILPLIGIFFLVSAVHAAVCLGDSDESIMARYGNPLSVDVTQHRTAYQWDGWRLDIGYLQGTTHRLVFTKDAAPISEAEEQQILNDNGGIASWQAVEGDANGKKWRRATDSAEAFSDGGRTLTLVTKAWADAQAAKAFYAPVQPSGGTPRKSQAATASPQAPADPLAPLTVMLFQFAKVGVGAVIFIGIVGLLYQVGVTTVRELFGVLTAEKADHAILVTTGKFTRDARSFAAGKPLELIEGNALDALIRRVGSNGQIDLLAVATWSRHFAQAATISDPDCPLCHSAMVVRRGRQSGNQFWGCSTYPRCRGKRNVRAELMQVRVD